MINEQMNKLENGFTLVELLVVLSIIILLSALGITSYRSAHRSARNGKRKSDLEQIRSALEMYRDDNDVYPAADDSSDNDWSTMITALESGNYFDTPPTDPSSYSYYYNTETADGYAYTLCAYLEGETGSCTGDPDCGGETCNYQVNNP